ncbi:MAG: alpha/beta hydrolase, partial [Bdellovibrionales bacterium]|nr:alpha/beta hydrolase [Bdellovibrionales bacterium]
MRSDIKLVIILLSYLIFPLSGWAETPQLTALLAKNVPYSVTRDVPYCHPAGLEQKLDVFLPESDGPHPVVIMIHGGGWAGRDKSHKNFQEMADSYAKRGFAVFNVNYRLSKVAPAPAAVQDINCAARFIMAHKDQYRVDTNRMMVTGNSAGCHLGLMLAMCDNELCTGAASGEWSGQKPEIKLVINRFGITDAFERAYVGKGRRSALQWFQGVSGDPKDLAKRMSPVNYAQRKDLAPIFTIHGDADTNTPVAQGVRLHEALLAAGNISKLKIIPGGNHGLHNISKE